MKKPLILSSLVLLSAACQQTTTATRPVTTAPVAAAAPAAVAPRQPAAPTPTLPLNAEAQAFLAKYDVGKLLLRDDGPFNGFLGSDHYRVEVMFTEVVKDEHAPNVYRVRGKSRFKKVVTPLSGSFTITELRDQPKATEEEQQSVRVFYSNEENAYSVLGTFELREDSSAHGAGVFAGRAVIDFSVGQSGLLAVHDQSPRSPAQDAGILLKGQWTSYATHKSQPVALAYYIWAYGESVLKNFNVGERGPEINPKYAKLGWNEFWDQEEWWAEPGTVTIHATRTILLNPPDLTKE
ncbi:hypothetical protein [Hymenobacter chitinivorans]|uniref:Uncharacterized protein n=1 Tax=Hymenobacter chitinivorans DSM 11115 TaxID=1121954 RepID=A0A2M9BS00_9BACT|nr:hypothetical protein [Hymenobacter chitinivorans]PJJ60734.1 hypothetical protein CLV45_2165 [Hymenobacter chitinivorans DSM 11115]